MLGEINIILLACMINKEVHIMIAFYSPQTIHFGFDTLEKVGQEAKDLGSKALLITDEMMNKVGYVETCQNYLQEVNVAATVYQGVNSEPNDKHVYEALQLYKENDCEFIISLGGGSCIDTAKAVSVLVYNDFQVEKLLEKDLTIENEPVAHIAIPTTAGTGSEVTDATVITHTETDVKMMMKRPIFLPKVAIVDPNLTRSCPQGVIAGTGVDAFCHAVEAYISKKRHHMTDTLALSAMKLIINNIESAYNDEGNLASKEAMSLGSLQAGLAFSNASVCLVHGMSRPIGALFHVPHGISNAMLLPVILKYNKSAALDEMATLGKMFKPERTLTEKEDLAQYAIEQIEKLVKRLNIPNLKGWGIDEQAFKESLNKMATDAIASGSPANNPIVPSKEEIIELYLQCYDY